MFGENAVRRRAGPIASAMEWKRFLKISNSTGSGCMWRSVPEPETGSQPVQRCSVGRALFELQKWPAPVGGFIQQERVLGCSDSTTNEEFLSIAAKLC